MARDYEDLHNPNELTDSELCQLVREQIAETSGLDVTEMNVSAAEGVVTLSGRVGTAEERRIAEHMLTDVLGIQLVRNRLVVDPNYRAATGEAADEVDRDSDDLENQLDVEVPLSGESPYFADGVVEKQNGADDMESVMEDGTPWSPPMSPTPEGLRGTDAGPEEMGGRH